jgi:type IV pilus assembly protein PilA
MLEKEKGFTLIELLIVAIIAILAAIAIPQFSAYRVKAYNAAGQSDLKNFKTKMEASVLQWIIIASVNVSGNIIVAVII